MAKTIAVIGGDMRQIAAARHLQKSGFDVRLFGFNQENLYKDAHLSASAETALSGAKIVLLGLPASDDCKINSAPAISIDSFVSMLDDETIVTGGKLSPALKKALEEKGVYYADYLDREEFAILNAVPTAEGAIEIAMRHLPKTLHGMKVLVVGFGRIGKVLAKMLAALGADVTCSARKCSDLAWIKVYGYTPVTTNRIAETACEYQLIFNTVPHMIFDREMLQIVRGDALITDLASTPGGVDFDEAKKLGINVIWALSLPGKASPESAGEIIADTLMNIVNEI